MQILWPSHWPLCCAFVLQKALGEDLRLNPISEKELLNQLVLLISYIFHIVCVYI